MKTLLAEFCILDNKKIRIINDDMTLANDEYDIVFCSAFKGDYIPVPNTLIHALLKNKGISVEQLSMDKEIDLSMFGGWLSKEIPNSNFKRIGCVEIFSFKDFIENKYFDKVLKIDKILTQTFSTLSYIIKQASFNNITLKKIALPILGTGNQEIELEYLIPPLFSECLSILKEIDSLEEITFYEINKEKANKFSASIAKCLNQTEIADVFISYSTKNETIAREIAQLLKDNHIKYWMAPESIPSTSNYLTEITQAIKNISVLIVILTAEAEKSPWVPCEVASAKGASKVIFGIKPWEYEINDNFQFLLATSQIYPAYQNENYKDNIVEILNGILNSL